MDILPQKFDPQFPIKKLKVHPKNPNRGDRAAIKESIDDHGFYGAVLAQKSTGYVLAGNHRLLDVKDRGEKTIPTFIIDCDDKTALKILVGDNQIARLPKTDDEILLEHLNSLMAEAGGLVGTGFGDDAIAQLEASIAAGKPVVGNTDPDEVPPVPEVPVSRLGDLWLLGSKKKGHRLICGDAINENDVALLMDSALADMVFTDPPYGVDLRNTQEIPSRKRADNAEIANDHLTYEELLPFLRDAFAAALRYTNPGAPWYVSAPHGPIGIAFSLALREIDVWRHSLVWVKDSLVMGRADYHYRHEPIYYGWSPGAAHHAVPSRDQDSVWEIPRPKKSPEHPTMKPVALMEKAIANSSAPGEIVLDLFGGSGSTLIAATTTHRRCFMAELEPKYVDVIINRWQAFSGETAVLESTGQTFHEVSACRKAETPEPAVANPGVVLAHG